MYYTRFEIVGPRGEVQEMFYFIRSRNWSDSKYENVGIKWPQLPWLRNIRNKQHWFTSIGVRLFYLELFDWIWELLQVETGYCLRTICKEFTKDQILDGTVEIVDDYQVSIKLS